MSNIIQRLPSPPAEQEFSAEQLELIKSTVAKGATNDELKLFLYRCKNMGLDPLKPGMVHFVKYGTSPGTMIVGIEGFRSRAERTGKRAGTNRGVIRDENGRCIGAWCEVYRKDWDHPAREEVSLAEYNTGKSQWAKMPETMIKKVAEAAALRMAFPDELGGVYTHEEMSQAGPDPRAKEIEARIANEPDIEIAHSEIESTIGDYIIKAGQNKGKKLNQVAPKKLENFVHWYDEESQKPGSSFHKDTVEYYEKAKDYLSEILAKEDAP